MDEILVQIRRAVLRAIVHLRGSRCLDIYKSLCANEKKSREEISVIEAEGMRKVLINAKDHVPFYRDLLAGAKLETIDEVRAAHASLPVISKKFLQENWDRMVSDAPFKRSPRVSYTGGSTGEPLRMLNDWAVYDEMDACMMRSMSWGGWSLGQPMALFWGGLRDYAKKKRYSTSVKEMITGRYFFQSYSYNSEIIRYWIDFLRQRDIHFIYGYASVLNDIAATIRKNGLSVPRIRAIYSTAETLFSEFRQNIEDVFQCKVFDQYGSREVISIASECESGNFHIFSDMVHLEFLEEESTGIRKVIATTFVNPAMPFIKYELGDYASPKNGFCRCGRNFPMMDLKIGRRNDHVRLKDGRIIYPSYFIHLLDGIDGIQNFQFIQEKISHINFLYIPNNAFSDATRSQLAKLESKICENLGERMVLELFQVQNLELPPSGKHRFVIYNVKE